MDVNFNGKLQRNFPSYDEPLGAVFQTLGDG